MITNELVFVCTTCTSTSTPTSYLYNKVYGILSRQGQEHTMYKYYMILTSYFFFYNTYYSCIICISLLCCRHLAASVYCLQHGVLAGQNLRYRPRRLPAAAVLLSERSSKLDAIWRLWSSYTKICACVWCVPCTESVACLSVPSTREVGSQLFVSIVSYYSMHISIDRCTAVRSTYLRDTRPAIIELSLPCISLGRIQRSSDAYMILLVYTTTVVQYNI